MDAVALLAEKLKIDEETRRKIGKAIGRNLTQSWDDSTGRRELTKQLRDAYHGVLKAKPLDWMSNTNIPLISYMVKQAAVSVGDAATAVTPLFDLEAADPDFDAYATNEEEELEFWNTRVRARSKIKMAVKDSMITGQCWLRPGVRDTGKSSEEMEFANMTGKPISADLLDVEPDLRYVIAEDMLLCPYTAPNFRQANGAFARTWLRWQDMNRGKKLKTFYPDAVDLVAKDWQKEHTPSQTHEQQEITESVPDTIWQAKFECWEGIFRYAKPGSDDETEWLVLAYWDTDSQGDAIVLKCAPYRELYGDQWFFIPVIHEPQPNSMWGKGIAESIRGLQSVMNATTNSALDAITICVLPPVGIVPGSEAYRKKLKWGPLERWPLSNPQTDVQILGGNTSMIAGIQAMQNQTEFYRGFAERDTGVNDLRVGKQEPERRTAYEIRARMGAGWPRASGISSGGMTWPGEARCSPRWRRWRRRRNRSRCPASAIVRRAACRVRRSPRRCRRVTRKSSK